MRLSLRDCARHTDDLVQRLAYRAGVSTAITSPISDGLLGGLGTHFSLGAKHKLEREAVLSDVTAVHVAVLHQGGGPSVSTQIAALRHLLLGPYTGERGASFEAVVKVFIHDLPPKNPNLTWTCTGRVAFSHQSKKCRRHRDSFEAQARSRSDFWYTNQDDPCRRRRSTPRCC